MAFGFGFNKQKALSAAEKYVQQGKMQNAIAEYEKVIKADPKDLTVTNTIGDLYSRLGDVDKATDCFKTVGDAYATQGFTVKAIAMYKKISKLKPSLESVLKLAELYTQQGLFNDARAQYLQVAEEFLKSGELDNAVRIFQKILEMDPENTTMRVKLAEVYVRLGKKNDAWQIFSAAAETLRAKGSLNGAEEVLQRMLTLDPGNSYALLMQGRNLLESGDAEAAIESLQKVSDLDSNPDGLRDLLKAYLKNGRLSDAGLLASKLLTIHNDLASISVFADALMQAGQYENALQVYDQHADRLLAEDSDRVLKNLHSIIGHVRDNPASLEKLLDLFQKAGESTHITEVIELLAHASVQAGDLPRARDLYQKLTTMEPGNPLHMNHYQQVVSQLGGPSADKLISAEEAAVIVDELEATSPSIHQHYSDAVALAVRSALTDAELFISYNMPAKALGPLTAALPQAPNDLRLNQRLAALHTRASRFAEAGVCCRTLQGIYSEAGYPEEATRYGELADRYEQRSSASSSTESIVEHTAPAQTDSEEIPAAASAPWPAAATESSDELEFAVVADENPEQNQAQEIQAAEAHEQPAVDESPAAPAEIDLSSEWDDAITIEAEDASPEEAAEIEISDAVADEEIPAPKLEAPKPESSRPQPKKLAPEKIAESVEEIRFYLEHGMPEQATAAFEKLQALTTDEATLSALRAEIEAAAQPAPAAEEVSPVESVSEFTIDEPSAEFAIDEVPAAAHQEPAVAEAEEAVEEEVEEIVPETPALVAEVEVSPVEAPPLEAPAVEAKLHAEPTPGPVAVEPGPAPTPGVFEDFVSDLESSLGKNFLPGAVPHQDAPAFQPASQAASHPHQNQPELEPIGNARPTSFGVPQTEVIGEFVADLEASLGEDFLKDAPVPEPAPAPQPPPVLETKPPAVAVPAQQRPVSTPQPASPISIPAAASAAAASAGSHTTGSHTISAQTSAPAAQQSGASAVPAPRTSPLIPGAPTAAKSSPFGEDAGIDLAEMFGELKQDLESGAAAEESDPETHYNLGIAFREMGLLDEAIGELQKTCQAVDRGHPFPQVMQTYTWLAQCFLDKGVPEAAIRWYQKALTAPGIDEETRTALHYELASAYELAGDKPSALKHFMEVYGRNIDYRDVAERIKPLKS
ncbi:MAG TPA: tetratricopeptide repeat protein [Candidatus Sulfotelmatobacter sp.]|jgi:tetratricopeptide (TPR) repeat protein|nr:tetratricopeptide repeat protein [Candidatus Sulfotelmatobacter sp.]